MLPRRHILDIWEFMKDVKELVPMATLTLAVDAVKHIDPQSKKDHLVETLELNEFICYMYPTLRPKNRALLFHVVSDLLGLLMYGIPRKSKTALDNIETINYSEKNIELYPIVEVWNHLKDNVYRKKHGETDIIQGFIKKIRVEMDIVDRYPFVEDILLQTRENLKKWTPSLANYYDRKAKTIREAYETWWTLWHCGEERDTILESIVHRLALQAAREFETPVDESAVCGMIAEDREANKAENELFSHWYRDGVTYLLKI